MIKQWMEETGETMSEGTEAIFDAIGSAAGIAEAKISSWIRTVETFIADHRDTVTEDIQEAWNTMKQAAEEAGSIASEKLQVAYEIVDTWIASLNETEAATAQEALDGLMDQAQTVE